MVLLYTITEKTELRAPTDYSLQVSFLTFDIHQLANSIVAVLSKLLVLTTVGQ